MLIALKSVEPLLMRRHHLWTKALCRVSKCPNTTMDQISTSILSFTQFLGGIAQWRCNSNSQCITSYILSLPAAGGRVTLLRRVTLCHAARDISAVTSVAAVMSWAEERWKWRILFLCICLASRASHNIGCSTQTQRAIFWAKLYLTIFKDP